MLFVAAAGNDGRNNDTTPTYPSSYASEAIVSVAATDHDDALAFFSNYGATSVDLGAPGVNILSTTPGNAYESFSGTSMATPHVAGVAALLKARFPGASPYGLKALLLRSVDPVAALAGRTATGGRLNAFTARLVRRRAEGLARLALARVRRGGRRHAPDQRPRRELRRAGRARRTSPSP